jgi:flagellar biogenesis protein FliO
MRISVSGGQSSRGITVLGLLLLILALVALGFFLVRYLGNRPAGGQQPFSASTA